MVRFWYSRGKIYTTAKDKTCVVSVLGVGNIFSKMCPPAPSDHPGSLCARSPCLGGCRWWSLSDRTAAVRTQEVPCAPRGDISG